MIDAALVVDGSQVERSIHRTADVEPHLGPAGHREVQPKVANAVHSRAEMGREARRDPRVAIVAECDRAADDEHGLASSA